MRFKDFLLETDLHGFDLEKFMKDCAPFLEEIRGIDAALVPEHGTKRAPDHWAVIPHVPRSGPRDSPPELHDLLNIFFEKTYGWSARSDAIFITASHRQAKAYGLPCLIFPVGDFSYIWSPDVSDAWSDYQDKLRYQIAQEYGVRPAQVSLSDPAVLQVVTSHFEEIDWKKDKDLAEALESENEIMLKSNSGKYYLFNANSGVAHWLVEKLQQQEILK